MGPVKLTQHALSTPTPRITVAEFAYALLKRWVPQRRGRDILGLAISGGVDSMALAALCSQLQDLSQFSVHPPKQSFLRPLQFRAFIVDHGLRAGSALEAEAVSRVLEGRDIKTQILKIEWPEQGCPASLSNFESLARKHRFRLLGRACCELGINSLLLAHHEDDQAETILMRLALGQGANGLTGMKNPAGIPECYGIHGVYESGGYDVEHRGNSASSPSSSPRPSPSSKCQLPIETGGIQVYRPFLHITKSRLIATCLAENIEWFEDHTNKEPTTAMRNAVRHMYTNHSMPAALSKLALLTLSDRLNDAAARRSHIVQSWLAKCKITRFETSTGIVNVQFADLSHSWESEHARPPVDAGRIAAQMLREIILLVTHREHVELSSLHSAVQQIFPEICQHGEKNPQPLAFTASGVYFQPVPTTPRQRETPNFIYEKPRWILSRQPYKPNSLTTIQIDVRAIGNSWSHWYFYDGRYWIRVQNLGTSPLLLKPFNREQLAEFRAALERANDERAAAMQLRRQLKNKAPAKVRYTLPAIMKSEGGKETIIALPSLGLSIPGCKSVEIALMQNTENVPQTAE